MNNYQTPIIVRADNNGNLVAIFPTLHAGSDQCMTANARGYFNNQGEAYNAFIKRTTPVSAFAARKYVAALNIDGQYQVVERATKAMHALRRKPLNAEHEEALV